MAKKKTTAANFDIKKLVEDSGSYKSLIYGALTVLVLAAIIFLGIRTLSQNQGDLGDGAVTIEDEGTVEYEVVEGDTLWSISEKVYGTGFNWQMIAEANNIADPNNIEKGTKLKIPSLTPTPEEAEAKTEEEGEKMEEAAKPEDAMAEDKDSQDIATDTEYVVAKGDYLWKIAEKEYGDGYKWVEIARANNLTNPDIIHTGNKLVIPR